jgi:uncharacterized protein
MRHKRRPKNPFTFGDLALDETFTDREEELAELASDMLNGQNVLIYAPRRYGKSSLVLRAAQLATRDRALVAYCDLMTTPTKERFAAALARTIYADLSSPVGQAFERAADLFRGLRVRPTFEVDPTDGSLRFTFEAGRRKADLDETIGRLLELPGEIAAERERPVVVVFDEFQEVLSLDKHFPNLMRAVFQTQPEVSHVYLGSRRHLLARMFSDRNEPFWRSAKQVELGPISAANFAGFVRSRFEETGKRIDEAALERLLEATGGHPYATQELAYFVWELVPPAGEARTEDVEEAISRVLQAEHNNFSRLWEEAPKAQRQLMLALAEEPSRSVYSAAYQSRHDLPTNPTIQTALRALAKKAIAGRNAEGEHCLVEPFFAEWLKRRATRDH